MFGNSDKINNLRNEIAVLREVGDHDRAILTKKISDLEEKLIELDSDMVVIFRALIDWGFAKYTDNGELQLLRTGETLEKVKTIGFVAGDKG